MALMNDDLDRLMDRVLGPETAEICRQELPWLRGRDRRFRATVVDAGGGEVRLLVDRDTEHYPEIGSRVEVNDVTWAAECEEFGCHGD